MPVKIRLARHGKKNNPFYHIVVADSRAPRDGRFIERIGSYNPNTNPAFIELNFDKALNWLHKGAQPTDTCRSILSRQGVLLKKHLIEGVKKNAFTQEEGEVKFQKWLEEKRNENYARMEKLSGVKSEEQQKALAAENKVREARAEAISKKNAQLAAKVKREKNEDSEQQAIEAESNEDVVTPEEPKTD